MQNDLDCLVEWADKWQMQFNAEKCSLIHFGKNNNNAQYYIKESKLTASDSERDLGVFISCNLKSRSHIDQQVAKANKVLGYIFRTIENKSPQVIVPLYRSLVRPHLEYCVQAWSPHFNKDINKLEQVQRRAVRMIKGIGNGDYQTKLRSLNLFSLDKRRLRGDLIETFKILTGLEKVDKEYFFSFSSSLGVTRGHKLKLAKPACRTDVRKFFFTNRIISTWNSLPAPVIECKTVDSFKHRLDKYFLDMNVF